MDLKEAKGLVSRHPWELARLDELRKNPENRNIKLLFNVVQMKSWSKIFER